MKSRTITLIGVLLIALALFFASRAEAAILKGCSVVKVHDGDTVTAQCPQRAKALVLRIAEIDSPELKAFTWPTQPRAVEARDAARALCLKKMADVHLVVYDGRTRRWVARVVCEGRDLSEAQVAAGLAWVYLPAKGSTLPGVQRAAQDQRVGMWADTDPAPVAPSQWRKGRTE